MKDVLTQEIDEAVYHSGGTAKNREEFPHAVIRALRIIHLALADRKAEIDALTAALQEHTVRIDEAFERINRPDWRERR